MRFDSLGLVDFVIGLVDSVLPGGQVNFFLVEGGGGEGERTGEGRMEERMEKGPTFHFVIRAMRKSSRLLGKGNIFLVSDMKILTVGTAPESNTRTTSQQSRAFPTNVKFW